MAHSIWTDLCKQPTHPVSTENYATIVYYSTIRLHEPIDSILSTLNERAMALSKLANFDCALRDANVMQQLSPSSPLGYVRAADIYSEQGKQRHVVDVCNRGLTMVERDDMHYGLLQRAKDSAIQLQDKRIDFISQLPIDIVSTTLIPMITGDSPLDSLKPCPHLHVSNAWRDYFLRYSDGLRFETGDEEEEEDLEKCSQIVRFARHITALHVDRYSKGAWLSDLFRENDFSSLQELCVYDMGDGYMNRFISSLQSVGSRLTHLNIHDDFEDTIPVTRVLSACPNLVSLVLHEPDIHDFKHLPMTPWPNMTTLSIVSLGERLGDEEIHEICQRFPALRKFDLHPCLYVESALMIPHYCPLLKSVELAFEIMTVGVAYTDRNAGSEDVVVTKISVYMDDWEEFSDVAFEDFHPTLRRHHTTLEDIEWYISPERDFHDLVNMPYPRLKKLSLLTSAPPILQNALNLEELTMTSNAINANPAILDTIPSTLKKLKLKLHDGRNHVDPNTIERYLGRVAQQCRIQELTIHVDMFVAFENILQAVYRFSMLQRLMLKFRRDWEPYQTERFLDGLVNACPHLFSLDIDCNLAPSTYSMNALTRLVHLKEFAFSIKDMGPYDSFWLALRTFSQLKCIRVRHQDPITNVQIRQLKNHRPDMNVIIDGLYQPVWMPS
ncbi:hypothetical protein O0I10_006264 [Lichtheimia ornata]|uniref:F-box domain-containing protein n=1 Tax=Lichtheimia ornata TaxID=688661 RepID=A0AAD7V271_9FUNG|nr:uncharacterized protein O0I10_006264 [Lichtheimia ornata]KAJ8657993.1 hypothetical protein O0I10_006264 [Lichtheimia ornata]